MKPFLIIFSLFLLPMGSPAGEAEPEQEETLKPVLVTTTRLKDVEEEASRIPSKVVVITKDDIARQGAKTVQEALQYQTGIVLYDLIGNEFQSTVDLRGFNGEPGPATTVFVDGVRVNEQDLNQVNFDLIPIEDVEKIEILYGPGTMYGRNSLGGVINITMKRGSKDKPSVSGETGGGSYFRQKYSFAADIPLPLPNLNYYFSGTRELSNGYRQDSDGRITRIFNKLGYFNESGTDATLSYTHVTDLLKQAGSLTQAQLGRHRRDNLTPGDFHGSNYNLVILNLRQKLPAGFSMALNSFYRGNDTEIFTVGLSNFISDAFIDYQQWGGTLQFSNDRALSERNSFNLGIEYGNNHFTNDTTSSFLGFPLAPSRTSTDEDVVGVYLLDTLDIFESLSVTGGFRYDWDRIDQTDRITPALSFVKTFNRFSPRAGIVYNPLPTLSFYFNYSQGFRTPTVSEFRAFLTVPVIFTDLDPVRSQNFEVGVRGRLAHWLDGSVVFFYTPVKDEIFFVVTDPSTGSGRNLNINSSLKRGVEITINGRYGKRVNGFLNYTYTKATFETDVLLFSGQVRKGDEFPLVPNHRVGIGVNFLPTEGLTVSLFGNYVGSQYLLGDEPNQLKKLDDYFVLNGKASYNWKNFTAYITGSNLTNNKFETFGIVGGFPAQPFLVPFPTTTVFAGIKFRYNKQ